jgi:hypothetical protein
VVNLDGGSQPDAAPTSWWNSSSRSVPRSASLWSRWLRLPCARCSGIWTGTRSSRSGLNWGLSGLCGGPWRRLVRGTALPWHFDGGACVVEKGSDKFLQTLRPFRRLNNPFWQILNRQRGPRKQRTAPPKNQKPNWVSNFRGAVHESEPLGEFQSLRGHADVCVFLQDGVCDDDGRSARLDVEGNLSASLVAGGDPPNRASTGCAPTFGQGGMAVAENAHLWGSQLLGRVAWRPWSPQP